MSNNDDKNDDIEIFNIESNNQKEIITENNKIIDNNKNNLNDINENNNYNNLNSSENNLNLDYLKVENENENLFQASGIDIEQDENNYDNIIEKEKDENNKIKILEEENKKLKSEINNYKSKNVEAKYRELLLEYDTIQLQSNKNILQNEELKKKNEELEKESSNYKNKYNSILKEQKKTKLLLEDLSINYNMNISFKDELEKQKKLVDGLKSENEEIKKEIEIKEKKLVEEKSVLNNKILSLEEELKNKEKENKEINNSTHNDTLKHKKEIDSLKEQLKKEQNEKKELKEKNKEINNKLNSLNKEYSLLKSNFEEMENSLKKIKEENCLFLEKNDKFEKEIKNLEKEKEKNICIIEENNKKNHEIIAQKEKEMELMKQNYDEEVNKLKKEIEDFNKNINELKIKVEKQNKSNAKLESINKELVEKMKDNKNGEEIIKERDNYKLSYEKLNTKYNQNISKFQSQINNMNELFLNNNNNENYNQIINDLKNEIKKLSEEKNLLLSQIEEILLENQELSIDYQNNLSKLKKNLILDDDQDNGDNFGINLEEVLNPNSLSDYINKCTDALIKINNENYNLKNEINNIVLKANINNKESNEYKIINEKLKKTIENYSFELDKKKNVLNKMNTEKNQIGLHSKKIENDRQYLMTILSRICKLFSNSNITNLLNDIINNNLSINQREKINKEILKEIKNFENYVKDLKDSRMRMNYIKKNNNINNNNIIINNNSNNIDSINSINEVRSALDKFYLNKNF